MKFLLTIFTLTLSCYFSFAHAENTSTKSVEGTLQDCLNAPNVIHISYLQLREVCFTEKIVKVEWHKSVGQLFEVNVDEEIPTNYASAGVKGVIRIQALAMIRGLSANIFISFSDGRRIERTLLIPDLLDFESAKKDEEENVENK